MKKPSKSDVKKILHAELVKFAAQSYDVLNKIASEDTVKIYELDGGFGLYQVRIELLKADTGSINILGSIDGPGVRHFLGFVSSITDQVSVSHPN